MAFKRSRSAIRDPKLRRLAVAVLVEYRRSGSAAQNENLKHVLRMIHDVRGQTEELKRIGCDPEALEMGILVSDVGKEPHFIEKHLARYRGNGFRAFMDHSRISMIEGNRLRRELGVPDRAWRRILGAIIGHDGPSIDGSWWRENYERELGKRYANLHSKEGLVHCYLDRMDQGGVFRGRGDQLNGGLRKISYDLFAKGAMKGNLAGVIHEIFGATRYGTIEQLEHLDQSVKPRILGSTPIPAFLREKRKRFDEAEKYFEHVLLDHDRPETIRIVLDDGQSVEVGDLDQFWRLLSKVTPKNPLAAACRIAR